MSGGGTGGHIYPAIAIANQIKKEFKYIIISNKNQAKILAYIMDFT